MSDLPEPDWNLLPGNPAAFFGLPRGFDLRALKSAYGALLRRFKPEKAPEEFQRIRAAFEDLKARFDESEGRPMPTSVFDSEVRPWPERPRPRERRRVEMPSHEPRKPAIRSLHDRYQDHRAADPKSPQDYYALALLSDLVDDNDAGFAWWLHAGLRHHPDEPALARLLAEYLATDDAAENAEWLLVATSQALSDDRFYDVTRPLWDRLLGAIDFATFQKLLDACEANLDGEPGEGYVAFYWWLMRRAIWGPYFEWTAAKITELESCVDLTRWDAARDRDLVDHLIIYRQVRPAIIRKVPIRQEMDRTVIACTTSGWRIGDRRMMEAQKALASRKPDLLRGFPLEGTGVEALVIVWEHLSNETADRLGISLNSVEAGQEAGLREFAARLPAIGWRPLRWLQAFWSHGVQWILKAIIAVVWTMIAFAVVTVVLEEPGALIGALIGITGVSIAMRWLWRLVAREQAETRSKAYRRLYRHVWRPRIMAFLETTSVPVSTIVSHLTAGTDPPVGPRQSARAACIAECLANDVGLRFLEIARAFERHAPR